MTEKNPGAAANKKRGLEKYLANPKHCNYCKRAITIPNGKKPGTARRKKFCNHKCAGKATQLLLKHKTEEQKEKYCLFCQNRTTNPKFCSRKCAAKCSKKSRLIGQKTKDAVFTSNREYHSSRGGITRDAARTYKELGKTNICNVCSYNKHVEICHIKPVSKFPGTALVKEINDINNLIALCPNCHWEFDHGLLNLGGVNSIGRIPDCDSGSYEFEPRTSPQ